MSGGYQDYVHDNVEKALQLDEGIIYMDMQQVQEAVGEVIYLTKADHAVDEEGYYYVATSEEDNNGNLVPVLALAKDLSFSGALDMFKDGHELARTGWNGNGLKVGLMTETEMDSFNEDLGNLAPVTCLPYLYLEYPAGSSAYPNGAVIPWAPTQTDILAEDWYYVS